MAENNLKAEREAFIAKKMADENISRETASQWWRVMKSDTTINRITKELMSQGVNFHTARYRARKIARGKEIRPIHKGYGLTLEEASNFWLIPCQGKPWGYTILHKGKDGKYRECKAREDGTKHWCINYSTGVASGKVNSRGWHLMVEKNLPLASLIYVTFHNQSIPSGYCIDHIDGNPKNNDIANLKLVTRAENAKLYNRGNHKGE